MNKMNLKLFIDKTNSTKFHKSQSFSFCEIFGNFISRKSGQKCCIYGQNGKPLKKETVEKYLDNLNKTNFLEVHSQTNLTDFQKNLKLINWIPNENFTSVSRIFFFKNVFYLTDYIKEIYNLDYSTDLQVIPNIQVYKKELLKIELTTPDLKGLSMKDLNLAFAINSLNYEKFLLYPIKTEDNFKKEIRNINLYESRIKEEKEQIQQRTKLRNKYDSLVYDNKDEYKKSYNKILNNIEGKEEENSSSCCTPDSVCACKQASKYQI